MLKMELRIVLISTDKLPTPPSFGGAIETEVYEFARGISKRGHEVHLVAIPNPLVNYEEAGIHLHPLTRQTIFSKLIPGQVAYENRTLMSSTLQVLKILREIDRKVKTGIDVIQAHYFTTWIAPLLVKARLKVQIWHNIPKINLVNKLIAKKYDLICGVSKYITDSILKDLHVDPRKILLIPDFVNTEFFKPNQEFRKQYRKKLQIEDDEIVILYLGRIVYEKGVHHLLKAFAMISSKFRNVRLLIGGPKGHFYRSSEAYFDYLKHIIESQRLYDRVMYIGNLPKEHIPMVYNATDIVVVPELKVTGGSLLTILEAMACGKAVVAYESGGIPEVIKNGITGILVEKGNINQLAKGISLLIEDPAYRIKLADNAIKFVQKNASTEVIVGQTVKLYEDFMSRT